MREPLRQSRASSLLSVALVTVLCARAQAQSNPSVTISPLNPSSDIVLVVDGKVVDPGSVQLQSGQQVMVWIREFERLGWGKVEPGQGNQITLQGKGVTLAFTKNDGIAKVNSLAVRLPINTYMRDGKLMVPLSFVAKSLGYEYDCSYKTVASVITSPAKTSARISNAIEGKALYNGKGLAGITVRAVDPEYTAISGATAKTDAAGKYRIEGLADGSYRAYVYTGDNPGFFLRASEPVAVKGGETAQIPPIHLGRIIAAVNPKPGEADVPYTNGYVELAWTACDGAATYTLVLNKKGGEKVFELASEKPSARVPGNKLAAGASYEVQVAATNANGEFLGGTAGAGGAPWTFTTARKKATIRVTRESSAPSSPHKSSSHP